MSGSRALDAVMASPTGFRPRAGHMALSRSSRHIERVAPEGAANRWGSLSMLSFSDRVARPYVARAQRPLVRMFGAADGGDDGAGGVHDRAVEPTSWVFPRPWYQDELGWIAAARTAASASSPSRVGSAPARGARASGSGADASRRELPVDLPLDLIAPSFAAPARAVRVVAVPGARSQGRPAEVVRGRLDAPAGHALRAWSPLVSFQAAQAAEFMGSLVAAPDDSGAAAPAGQGASAVLSPTPTLSFVAPRVSPAELAATTARADVRTPARRSAPAAPATAPATARAATAAASPASPASRDERPAPAMSEALRNRLNEAIRRAESRRRSTPQRGQGQAGQITAQSAQGAPAPAAPERASSSAGASTPASAQPASIGAEVTPSERADTGRAIARASSSERAAELLARAALSGRGQAEPVAGPRIALPAGLGGLVAGIRAADVVSRPVAAPLSARFRPGVPVAAAAPLAGAAERALPVAASAAEIGAAESALPVVASGAPPSRFASTYRSVTAVRPNSLAHIAWADRWLARFAGSSEHSLRALSSTTVDLPATPGRAVVGDSSELAVFLEYLRPASVGPRPGVASDSRPAVSRTKQTGPAETQPRARPAQPAPTPADLRSAPRIGDDESVPDEVFAAIAAAAVRRPPRPGARAEATPPSPGSSAAVSGSEAAPVSAPERATFVAPDAASATSAPVSVADRLLASSPSLPGPGMRAALAASPLAPALAALLPLPASASFDVRAMHSVRLAQAYLAGIIEPAARPSGGVGAVSSFTPADVAREGVGPGMPLLLPPLDPARAVFTAPDRGAVARPGASPAATVRARDSIGTERAPAPAARVTSSSLPSSSLPASSLPASSLADAETLAAARASASRVRAAVPVRAAVDAALPSATPASSVVGHSVGDTFGPGQAAIRAESWSVARERSSADLAFDFVSPELLLAAQAFGFGPAQAAQAARLAVSGASGLSALAAAVDLRFVASVVEGGRGAGAGPGARAAAAAGPADTQTTVSSVAAGEDVATAGSVAAPSAAPNVPGGAPAAVASGLAGMAPAEAESEAAALGRGSSFGVPLRAPRGAFLWPQASVAAMNLPPIASDGAGAMSLAALELLAAGAVADMGIFVAPASEASVGGGAARPRAVSGRASTGGAVSASVSTTASASAPMMAATTGSSVSGHPRPVRASATPLAPDAIRPLLPGDSMMAQGAPAATYVTPVLDFDRSVEVETAGPGVVAPTGVGASATAGVAGSGSAVADVGSVATTDAGGHELTTAPEVEAASMARAGQLPPEFEAIYVTLARSPAGRSMSPAVRAARALALAGAASRGRAGAHGQRGPSPAQVRAAAAWAVMPMVLSGGELEPTTGAQAIGGRGAASPRRSERSELEVLATRAGSSLQSLIAPGGTDAPAPAPARSSTSSSGYRAPTAAPPLVQTGSTTSAATSARANQAVVQQMLRSARQQRASGSSDIPAWFEQAARRMFEDNSGDGISLAEMTLVTAAPARLVAASPKSASSGTPSARSPEATGGSESHDAEPTANVEQLAREVYAEICRLIDVARERNGDIWR
ncbi:hypothetical protein [Haliangium sp.]|uniref:hypothetical protein n=2 Tax=Haliangium sp. TaxID=2663208 RepID=UPI003D0ACCE9